MSVLGPWFLWMILMCMMLVYQGNSAKHIDFQPHLSKGVGASPLAALELCNSRCHLHWRVHAAWLRLATHCVPHWYAGYWELGDSWESTVCGRAAQRRTKPIIGHELRNVSYVKQ